MLRSGCHRFPVDGTLWGRFGPVLASFGAGENMPNLTEKITVRLSPTADARLIEKISGTAGQTVADRLRNYLRFTAPASSPSDPIHVDRITTWRVKKTDKLEEGR